MKPPQSDDESRHYWDGLAAERLRIQRCGACGVHRFPAMPGCPECGAAETAWIDAAGTGHLYSWITVHHAFSEEWTDELPYAIATVQLDEGCRMLARLHGIAEPAIDMPLRVRFVHHDGWSEARFGECRV